jgi:chromosome segregation ATPase
MPEEITEASYVVKWLFGIFSVCLVGIIAFIISNITAINIRMNSFGEQAATRTEKVAQLEIRAQVLEKDIFDKTVRSQELQIRLAQTESAIKTLEQRVSTISERVLTLDARLDQIKPLDHMTK